MKTLQLNVPEELVARVDRALKREGLDVHEVTLGGAWDSRAVYRDKRTTLHVVPGTPLPDVPRVIAYDGPTPRMVA